MSNTTSPTWGLGRNRHCQQVIPIAAVGTLSLGKVTNMLRMLAIGGGELREGETLSLDRRACELTGKRKPNALFVPTASNDSEGYIQAFTKVYGKKLGCRVQSLCLLANPNHREITEKILDADLIYVGGGNTLRMMQVWRRLGVDAELNRAARRGTVLCGLSAGAICWFRYGHSDSRSFSGQAEWSHIRVRGLDLVPLLFCPHYDSEKRTRPLRQMLSARGGRAIACDDMAALEIVGDGYRALAATTDARTVFLRKVKGRILANCLPLTLHYRPLVELTGDEYPNERK